MGKHAIRRGTGASNRGGPEDRISDGDTVDTMRYDSPNSDEGTAAYSRKGSDTVNTPTQIGETSKSPPGPYRIAPFPRGEKIRYDERVPVCDLLARIAELERMLGEAVPRATFLTLKTQLRDLRRELEEKDKEIERKDITIAVIMEKNVRDAGNEGAGGR